MARFAANLVESSKNSAETILKPSDLVVLLRPFNPCGTRENATAEQINYLCIVYRFWIVPEERDLFMFGLNSELLRVCRKDEFDEILRTSVPLLFQLGKSRLVSVIRVEKVLGGYLTRPKKVAADSGILKNGDLYFVARFLLYTDGYSVSSVTTASMEGIYLVTLNFPESSKLSRDIVRVLSVGPPGTSPYEVLSKLENDLKQGATEGFVDFDADGKRRRVFLDCVGIIGDTPALNGGLDVGGHNAQAPCHLCRLHTHSQTNRGSRYSMTPRIGSFSATARSMDRHQAMVDSEADVETLKYHGVQTGSARREPFLHRLSQTLCLLEPNVHRDVEGLPVLIPGFDPYIASYITPDHLLSRLYINCLEFSLFVLGSKAKRVQFENIVRSSLAENGLDKQNRLFDCDKSQVLSMTISQVYSLSSVSSVSFAYLIYESMRANNGVVPGILIRALQLQQTIAAVIGATWRREQCGYSVREVQIRVTEHIKMVRKTCALSENELKLLGMPGVSDRSSRSLGEGLTSNSSTKVVKILDKPNVHRLFEFAFKTLPIVRHARVVNELSFESIHAQMRRSIERSNRRNPHFHAMQNALIDDWKSRITLVRSELSSENYSLTSVQSAFRLIGGWEKSLELDINLPYGLDTRLKSILAGEGDQAFPSGIGAAGVMPPHARDFEAEIWRLVGDSVVDMTWNNPNFEVVPAVFKSYLRLIYSSDTISVSNEAVALNGFDSGRCRLSAGHVIEVECSKSENYDDHVPFVQQLSFLSHRASKESYRLKFIIQKILASSREVRGESLTLFVKTIEHTRDDIFSLQQLASSHRLLSDGVKTVEAYSGFKTSNACRWCVIKFDESVTECGNIRVDVGQSTEANVILGVSFGYPPRHG